MKQVLSISDNCSHEQSCRNWLNNVLGGGGIIDSDYDYIRLRQSIAATAGYLRNSEYYCQAGLQRKSAEVTEALTRNGYFVLGNIYDKLTTAVKSEIISYQNKWCSGISGGLRGSLAQSWSYSLVKLAIEPPVLRGISHYLHTKNPYLYTPMILSSIPKGSQEELTEKSLSDKAFLYHRDIDSTVAIKLFICLSDSDSSHHYISGSQKTSRRDIDTNFEYRIKSSPLFHNKFRAQTVYETHLHTGRFDENSLRCIFPKERFKSFPCRLGFAWLEDTYGLHRGSQSYNLDRHLFSALIARDAVRYA